MTVRPIACPLALWIIAATSGCATIVSEKRYPVTIQNAAAPTYFSVHNRKNEVIASGVTPQQVTLEAKSMPFWPARYTVAFAGDESTSQRREVKAGFDPWTAGNLVLGGGAGAIVDGFTGAMFKLPKTVEGDVPPQFAVTDPGAGAMLAGEAQQRGAEPKQRMASAKEPIRR